EALGLLDDESIRERWQGAVEQATDQRSLNIARNVKDQKLKATLETAADHAVKQAVEKIDDDLYVMVLIDKSGSMHRAIEQAKEALSRLLAGLSLDRMGIACFDTVGTRLIPKAASRLAVQHMLKGLAASGG